MKHYLKSIIFKEDYRSFKKGDTIDFKPVTVLVGDQGAGKSTILNLLNDDEGKISIDCEKVRTRFFDTEKMNPRLARDFSANIDMRAQLGLRWSSHGESVLAILFNIQDEKDHIIMIDEPESGLSIRSQYKLSGLIKKLSEHNQVIIASHSIPIIQDRQVYSVEHRMWMCGNEFIKTQRI